VNSKANWTSGSTQNAGGWVNQLNWKLLYNKSVEIGIIPSTLVDEKCIPEVLNIAQQATSELYQRKSKYLNEPMNWRKELLIRLSPSKIDIGKLASEWFTEKKNFATKFGLHANTVRRKNWPKKKVT